RAARPRNASRDPRSRLAAGDGADAQSIIQATIDSSSGLLAAAASGWFAAASSSRRNGPRRFIDRLHSAQRSLILEKVASKSLEKLLQGVCETNASLRSKWLAALPLHLNEQYLGSIFLVLPRRLGARDPRVRALHALVHHTVIALSCEMRASVEKQRVRSAERNRIVRDLHDRLGQAFGAILLQLEAMRAECGVTIAPMLGRIEEVGRLARHGIDEVRRTILAAAGPALLERRSLPEALGVLASEVNRASGVPFEFINRLGDFELDPSVAEHLFAIASEAVHNALRHARPTRIRVSLAPARQGFRMQIQDNGCGFVQGAVSGAAGFGFGLRSMQERARVIGASFYIRSVLDRGVSLRVDFPNLPLVAPAPGRSAGARRRTSSTSPIPPPQPRRGA
ncbi:MAG TPA: sensor histidine kinase, partial [Chthoniobacteraceae bacterium]